MGIMGEIRRSGGTSCGQGGGLQNFVTIPGLGETSEVRATMNFFAWKGKRCAPSRHVLSRERK